MTAVPRKRDKLAPPFLWASINRGQKGWVVLLFTASLAAASQRRWTLAVTFTGLALIYWRLVLHVNRQRLESLGIRGVRHEDGSYSQVYPPPTHSTWVMLK